jgi:hypothetical protein
MPSLTFPPPHFIFLGNIFVAAADRP